MVAKVVGKTSVLALDKLEQNDWNPNVQDEETFERERASIREFGFIDPITVREGREKGPVFKRLQILDGAHRLKAAEAEGLKEVLVHNIGRISDGRARTVGDLLNNLGGQNDPDKWVAMVKDVMAEDEALLDLLPYAREDIDAMLEPPPVPDVEDDDAPTPSAPTGSAKLYKKFTVGLPEATMAQAKDLVRRIKADFSIDDDAAAFRKILELAAATMVKRQSVIPPPPATRRKRVAV